ncbi:hypothetical protein CHARACLAT_018384 [Characodon lateralis]|uniref:Uncharacterized protein n=1 Tax=Characodon lateralis TaxID=208331 RepID=A0ABU7DIA5_9TELE|nr:hypothetical protein [Characodon lateralis]
MDWRAQQCPHGPANCLQEKDLMFRWRSCILRVAGSCCWESCCLWTSVPGTSHCEESDQDQNQLCLF